jgi:GT2 family glycosyltransferase/glycosyltransferase involved in cell wall biosynthesis
VNKQDNALLGKKICFVATVELPLRMFLHDQIRALSYMCDVVAVLNTKNTRFLEDKGVSIHVKSLPIEREIAPVSDAISLIRLTMFLSRSKFNIVHSINPKSGLIAMLAAYITRVPVRVHTFTGQVWVTRKGAMRWILKALDHMIALLATHVVTDSVSQLMFLREQGVLSPKKGFVPGSGSVGGVDISRFRFSEPARNDIRQALCIPDSDVVFLFVGRMNPDKGLDELAMAFCDVANADGHVHLLIVGPDEKRMRARIEAICRDILNRLHFIGYSDVPERYMSASDVLCLPSHREGFGTVVIEAAAVGLPSVGSRIYGLTDSIIEGETGLFHEVGDIKGLTAQMLWLAQHTEERRSMGQAACKRARQEFSQESLTDTMLEFYKTVLRSQHQDSASGIQYLKNRQTNIDNSCNISVVIVNYNAGEMLLKCVAQAKQQAEQIIVVDNASIDSSIVALKKAFPTVRLICNKRNLGFATACNLGTKVANGDHILFLNPDCILAPNAVSTLIRAVNSAPDVGMVGGMLTNPDGTEQAGGRRAVPTPWRSFVMAFGFSRLRDRYPELFSDFSMHDQPLPEHAVEVDAISGACMLVRRDALEEIGLLDEGYFMHCEDLDWCMRFRRHKWKVLFVPDARMVHFKGHCSNSRPIFVEWNKHKGMMRFYRKYYRDRYPGLLMFLVASGVWLRFGAMTVYHTTRHIGRMFGLRREL